MANGDIKKGVRAILNKLPDDCLDSLTLTVTQGLLKTKINTREDAIRAILKYSPSLPGILKRQKVTREILLEYAHDCKIPVKIPITKPELIEAICKHWKGKKNEIELKKPPEKNNKEDDSNNVQLLAEKFSEWFYSLLNSNEPIGVEHFFNDAKLMLNFISGDQKITKRIENNTDGITSTLFSTKNTHSLYFNPNLTKDGVGGRLDRHGLVIVNVCGTLHREDVCVGVFEQTFLLTRDPFAENNWKIKSTELNLRKSDSTKAITNSNRYALENTNVLLKLPNVT